jgi:Ferritin-like domain
VDTDWTRDRSRRALLKNGAVIGTGAIFGGLVLTHGSASTARAASKASDRKIFTFALTLEQLQVAFYKAFLAKPYATGEIRQYAEVVHGHEVSHVKQLTRLVGAKAGSAPSFTFDAALASRAAFLKAAIALEDLGAAAYDGQIPNLSREGLKVAAEIVSVESRHAAWIRDIAGKPPAPLAADPPATVQKVESKLRGLGIAIGGA